MTTAHSTDFTNTTPYSPYCLEIHVHCLNHEPNEPKLFTPLYKRHFLLVPMYEHVCCAFSPSSISTDVSTLPYAHPSPPSHMINPQESFYSHPHPPNNSNFIRIQPHPSFPIPSLTIPHKQNNPHHPDLQDIFTYQLQLPDHYSKSPWMFLSIHPNLLRALQWPHPLDTG